jgi:hypothetical protein
VIKRESDEVRKNDCRDASIWKKITDVTGFAKTDEKHKEILEKVFNKAVK